MTYKYNKEQARESLYLKRAEHFLVETQNQANYWSHFIRKGKEKGYDIDEDKVQRQYFCEVSSTFRKIFKIKTNSDSGSLFLGESLTVNISSNIIKNAVLRLRSYKMENFLSLRSIWIFIENEKND